MSVSFEMKFIKDSIVDVDIAEAKTGSSIVYWRLGSRESFRAEEKYNAENAPGSNALSYVLGSIVSVILIIFIG